jgi:Cd2+/Zn2+-exporting ATPase
LKAEPVVTVAAGHHTLNLDLDLVLPGEKDELGVFQKLEQLLEARIGITDVAFRKDGGHAEVSVHFDPSQVTTTQVLTVVRSIGGEVTDRYRRMTWFVRGMDSPQCAVVIEHSLNRMPGVLQANVAYAAERLVIEYDKEAVRLSDVEERVQTLGYQLEVPEAGHACSFHAHGGGLAPKLEMPLAITSGALIALGFLLEKLHGAPDFTSTGCYILALVAGGFFPTRGALNSLRQFRVDIETLMILAAVSAGFLGAWFEGGFLLFLFSVGHAFEHRAMDRARRAVEALGRLRPEVARVRRGAEIVEVPVGKVQRGDQIIVRAGDAVPLDGVIVEGQSSLNQATITGESVPVSKGPGDEVFAGTVNAEAALEVEVKRLSSESVLAKIVDSVVEAEAQKSATQRFTQKIEQRFVPIVLVVAVALPILLIVIGFSVQEAMLRAVGLLVAAAPCALAISVPSAVLSAVAAAARGGVLIKGGAHLETLGKAGAVAFDKTGTLTVGRPALKSVVPEPGVHQSDLLKTAASAECLSPHPLAKAVVEGAKAQGIAMIPAESCESVHGKGIWAEVGGERIGVGKNTLFDGGPLPQTITAAVEKLEAAGQTTMIVKRGDNFLGVLGVADTLRPECKTMLVSLKTLGIGRAVMLSGDNLRVAKAIGSEVGIDEVRAPLMPEQKVQSIRELAKEGGVAMVGDGVNDAPALAAASVGVAMGGAGSDVALETADVVLMADDLHRLPFAVGLARQATGIIRQNVLIAVGVAAVLVVATLIGWASVSQAVILHEGSTVVVVLNALRMLGYRG